MGLNASLQSDGWNVSLQPNVFYASVFGVDGNNSGARDDAPLVQDTIDAASSVATSTGDTQFVILPQGNVWLNSYAGALAYPGYYCVRINTSNVWLIIPRGCTIHTNLTFQGGANNALDLIQVTGTVGADITNSGVCGGGLFKHHTPGYTGTTPNNYVSAVHLSAYTDQCFIRDLYAYGCMCPAYGTFDNSSSKRGYLENLFVSVSSIGVEQSSAASTVKGRIHNVVCISAYKTGVMRSSGNVDISDIHVDNSLITAVDSNGFTGLKIYGDVTTVNCSNINFYGGVSKSGNDIGIFIQPSVFAAGGKLVFNNINLNGANFGVYMLGVVNPQHFTGVNINNCSTGFIKDASGGNHCADTWITDYEISNATNGVRCGFSAGTNTEGYFHLTNGNMTASVTTAYNNTVPIIASAVDVLPVPAIAKMYKYQRVVATAGTTVTATTGIDGLTLLLVPAGTLATLTVVWPTSPVDGQKFRLKSSQAVTTLTVTGTVAGSPTALTAGYDREFTYDSTAATWI